MRKNQSNPSFKIQTAVKNHTCIWCEKTIFSGQKYYSKTEHSKEVDARLEKATGWDIFTIKRRTHFWYCDVISWKFCGLECMSNWSGYTWETFPLKVRRHMDAKITQIVDKVKDIVKLMASLEGSNNKEYEELDV